jgi:hypothetical protein
MSDEIVWQIINREQPPTLWQCEVAAADFVVEQFCAFKLK